MSDMNSKIREVAKRLLESGEVTKIIGWEKGSLWYKSTPVFIDKVEDVDKLIFDEFCYHNLSKYLLDYRYEDSKIGIFVKGCDSRSINGLIKDNQISRDKVYLIGVPCNGMKEESAAIDKPEGTELPRANKCLLCKYPNPVVYDELVWDEVTPVPEAPDELLERVSAMSTDERYEFFQDMFSECIRCYACRNVCPVCSCKECCFDQPNPDWVAKDINASENGFYHLTRAMHIAGRCVGCGECERVCPQGLPVMLLNRKLAQEIKNLFNEEDAGVSQDFDIAMSHFNLNDPEEFM